MKLQNTTIYSTVDCKAYKAYKRVRACLLEVVIRSFRQVNLRNAKFKLLRVVSVSAVCLNHRWLYFDFGNSRGKTIRTPANTSHYHQLSVFLQPSPYESVSLWSGIPCCRHTSYRRNWLLVSQPIDTYFCFWYIASDTRFSVLL